MEKINWKTILKVVAICFVVYCAYHFLWGVFHPYENNGSTLFD